MPMQKTERLQLIEIQPFIMNDKITGEAVPKIRHTFARMGKSPMDEPELLNYYLHDDGAPSPLEPFLRPLEDKFDTSKSFAFNFIGRIWDEKIKWRLSPIPPTE